MSSAFCVSPALHRLRAAGCSHCAPATSAPGLPPSCAWWLQAVALAPVRGSPPHTCTRGSCLPAHPCLPCCPAALAPTLRCSPCLRPPCGSHACPSPGPSSFPPDFLNFYLFIFRGEGREKERERNINWLPLACQYPGNWPATQACALTGNRTGDTQPTEPRQPGQLWLFSYAHARAAPKGLVLSVTERVVPQPLVQGPLCNMSQKGCR